MIERPRLPVLVRRAFALRDQLVALIVLIVLIDVFWVFALAAWFHHRNGRTGLACICIAGTLVCAATLSQLIRREHRDVLAAIRRALRR